MKKINAIKAIAVSGFLLTTAGLLQAQTVTGNIYYAGKPITDYIQDDTPVYTWMRDESTGDGYYKAVISYSNGSYQITNIAPGSYGLDIRFDGLGADPNLGSNYPGDYGIWSNFNVKEGDNTHDIHLSMIMRLLTPADNAENFSYSSGEYPKFAQNEILFSWEAIAEASEYRYSVDRYKHYPAYQFIERTTFGTATNASINLTLADNLPGEHYELSLYAYDSENRLVGDLRVHYQNGYGWDYRFIIGCTASISGQTNVLCIGAATGSATVLATGGKPPYTYLWDDPGKQISATATGLTAGEYNVTVTDANLCTTTATATITQPARLIVTNNHTIVLCRGGSTGSATAIPSGGTSPYSYSWNTTPEQTTPTISNLIAGVYTVTVTDAHGCTAQETVAINQPTTALAVSASKVDVLCYGNATGSATANALGGISPYTYSWNTMPVQTSSTANNLAAGSYTVTVTDANGCIASNNVTITEPPVLSVNPVIKDVTCNLCKNAEINLLTVNGGNGSYSFLWTGPNGFSSTNQNITHLKPGNYSVLVKDANQCSKTFYFEVINPFVVTSTSDENVNGTLRHAINAANGSNTVSRDTITFSLQGSGPFTIQPGTFLPVISNPVIIDGYSQPNASLENSILLIDLDGSNPGLSSNGLTVNANNCIIKGLIIHDFSDNGIRITSGTGNRISANSIYENGLRGIDLKKAGDKDGVVTLNDDGDPDTGPNNLQNFPVLSSLNFSQGSVTVSGTLNTTPVTKSYTLEFYANKVADKYEIGGMAYGEGQTYIGSTVVTTDKKGAATFTTSLTTFSKYGDIITATATDPDGNTSEFSATIGGLQNQILASNKIPFQYKMNGSDIVKTNYTIPYTTI